MRKINLSLTTPGSLDKAIQALMDYKREIEEKSHKLVENLLEIGIVAARANCGKYAGKILFAKEFESMNAGVLIATDGEKIISEWWRGEELVSAEVSPLLMAEFGSGWFSEVLFPEVNGLVGQGTFPGQTHAFDEGGWYWRTTDEEALANGEFKTTLHHSMGENPTHPMHNALVAMLSEIDKIAKEVFKNG